MQLQLWDTVWNAETTVAVAGWWDYNCCCGMLGLQLLLWDAGTRVTVLWDAVITVVVVGCGYYDCCYEMQWL